MRFENLIRKLPGALLIVAAVDFVKGVLMALSYWHADNVISSTHQPSIDLTRQFLFGNIERIIGIFIYPLGWLTSAATLTVLLAIYDRGHS